MPHAELVNLPYPNVMLLDVLYISRYAISFGFHDAMLLDLLYLVLRCWTFPTSRQGAWCPLDHVRVSNPFSRCYIV